MSTHVGGQEHAAASLGSVLSTVFQSSPDYLLSQYQGPPALSIPWTIEAPERPVMHPYRLERGQGRVAARALVCRDNVGSSQVFHTYRGHGQLIAKTESSLLQPFPDKDAG
jgi:hypothetical protein